MGVCDVLYLVVDPPTGCRESEQSWWLPVNLPQAGAPPPRGAAQANRFEAMLISTADGWTSHLGEVEVEDGVARLPRHAKDLLPYYRSPRLVLLHPATEWERGARELAFEGVAVGAALVAGARMQPSPFLPASEQYVVGHVVRSAETQPAVAQPESGARPLNPWIVLEQARAAAAELGFELPGPGILNHLGEDEVAASGPHHSLQRLIELVASVYPRFDYATMDWASTVELCSVFGLQIVEHDNPWFQSALVRVFVHHQRTRDVIFIQRRLPGPVRILRALASLAHALREFAAITTLPKTHDANVHVLPPARRSAEDDRIADDFGMTGLFPTCVVGWQLPPESDHHERGDASSVHSRLSANDLLRMWRAFADGRDGYETSIEPTVDTLGNDFITRMAKRLDDAAQAYRAVSEAVELTLPRAALTWREVSSMTESSSVFFRSTCWVVLDEDGDQAATSPAFKRLVSRSADPLREMTIDALAYDARSRAWGLAAKRRCAQHSPVHYMFGLAHSYEGRPMTPVWVSRWRILPDDHRGEGALLLLRPSHLPARSWAERSPAAEASGFDAALARLQLKRPR